MSVEMKSDKDSKEYVQERTESNEETMKSRQRKWELNIYTVREYCKFIMQLAKIFTHTLKQKHHTKERESESERVNKSDKEVCVWEYEK